MIAPSGQVYGEWFQEGALEITEKRADYAIEHNKKYNLEKFY